MERDEIEREVARLAPWYYSWDLAGVRTDQHPACDDQGHRQVFCPPIFDGFWTGKSVLDVGCNEGAYGYGALDHGAAKLIGFDCRDANVEKARFVARVLGRDSAEFSVDTCDSWLERNPGARTDIVLMCGILYHLTDPVRTIRDYCAVANDWIFVTSCVCGTDEVGYTLTPESESAAASDGALDSLMPNNADTLVAEFQRNGFAPVHVEEARKADFWDGVALLLRSTKSVDASLEQSPGEVDVWLTPVASPDGRQVFATYYNRRPEPATLQIAVRATLPDGRVETLSEEQIELPARALTPADAASMSTYRVHAIPSEAVRIDAEVRDGAVVGGARAELG